jgi:hypothetical protein
MAVYKAAVPTTEAEIAVYQMLAGRESNNGDYATGARITNSIVRSMSSGGKNWFDMPDYMLLAMQMIALKQARIVNGSHTHIDSWRDIAGYAMLVVDELEKQRRQEESEHA